MTAATWYEIGTTFAGMQPLTTLGIPGVQSDFSDYAKSATIQDGNTRALGFPQAVWYCGYLTSAQFDVIRAICPGASANVYIATMNNDREFVRYSAIMKLPEKYEIRNNIPKDFEITFTHLIDAEPA